LISWANVSLSLFTGVSGASVLGFHAHGVFFCFQEDTACWSLLFQGLFRVAAGFGSWNVVKVELGFWGDVVSVVDGSDLLVAAVAAFGMTVSPVPGGGAGSSNPGEKYAQGVPHEAVGHGRSARQVQVLVCMQGVMRKGGFMSDVAFLLLYQGYDIRDNEHRFRHCSHERGF
jgi:hypothetical protein